MFDRVTAPQPAKRWKTFLLIGTAGAHAAVLAGLVLVAFWKIEQLPITGDREIKVTVQPEAQPPGGPPPSSRLPVPENHVVKPPPPPVPVQPVHLEQQLPATTGAATTGTQTGNNGDNPNGDPTSTLTGTGACATPPCGPEVDKPKPKPPVVEPIVVKPAILPPNVGAGLRLSGNEKIYPPDEVRVAMVHDDVDHVIGSVKVCVDAHGAVDSVQLAKSTGYAGYDRALLDAMRGWTYRPYTVNGVATPMCTVAQVIYRMTR